MTDFVVFAFVSIVVVMLIGGLFLFGILAIVDPDRDISGMISVFTDITTSLISALIGFLAGKGQGRSDLHEELSEMKRKEDEEPKP